MSIDEKVEEDVWKAVDAVHQLRKTRPMARERIFRDIITAIMKVNGWKEVHLKEDETCDVKTNIG